MRTYAPAEPSAVLADLLTEPSLARGVVHHALLPARAAVHGDFPDWLDPRIVAGLDPSKLRITTRVNGAVRQDSPTSDLIFDVPALIAFVSAHMTLEIGDVISTGTPAGVGPVGKGQLAELAWGESWKFSASWEPYSS